MHTVGSRIYTRKITTGTITIIFYVENACNNKIFINVIYNNNY